MSRYSAQPPSPSGFTLHGRLERHNQQISRFAWSPDGQYVAVMHTTSPYITTYKRVGDVLTKLANPATLPTGTGTGGDWSPGGEFLAVSHQDSPYVTVYKSSMGSVNGAAIQIELLP